MARERYVDRPTFPGSCWVKLRQPVRSLYDQYADCSAPKRRGLHTCRHHDKYEAEATALDKRLTAKAKERGTT